MAGDVDLSIKGERRLGSVTSMPNTRFLPRCASDDLHGFWEAKNYSTWINSNVHIGLQWFMDGEVVMDEGWKAPAEVT